MLSILHCPTEQIVRERLLPATDGAGVLWSLEPEEVLELSALGAMAWEGALLRVRMRAKECRGRESNPHGPKATGF